jgi:hypothetical protein
MKDTFKEDEVKRLCDSVYQHYPKKLGKAAGYRKLKHIVVDNDQFANFAKAVQNYNRYLKDTATTYAYTLHFSTFVNGRWEDFVDYQPVDDNSHMEMLTEIGLQFQFSKHIDSIKTIWPTSQEFKNYLLDKKSFCSKNYDISTNIERFRNFVAMDLSRKLGM